MTQAPSQPHGRRLVDGRYKLVQQLGHGSTKQVYLAHHVPLGRDVALALVPGAAPGTVVRKRLEREARVMAWLGEHPNIVTVYDFAESEGVPYVAARLMAGGTLADRLAGAPEGRLAVHEALRLARDIAAGLAHAHAQGVVHRDIKPANIWLDRDGHAALGDFGIALTPDDARLTAQGAYVGTPAFSAPEQLQGQTVDARADLYSLGVVLYELLCGAPPFVARSAAELLARRLEAEPPPLRRLNPEVPPWLERLVLALLAKCPDDRPGSAAEVLSCLTDERPAAARGRAGAIVTCLQGELVGREADLRHAAGVLAEPDVRLLTLCGPGGIGKTRLALALADAVRDRYHDGVHVVLLASLRSPEQVPSAIATTLDVQTEAEANGAMGAIVRHLAPRRTLLVLDNFEHVLDAEGLVSEMLAHCPRLDIVVTSREALRLSVERRLRVEPLSLPDETAPMTLETLEAAGATALFLARMRALGVDVDRSPDELRAASDVCARLDGVPLAIELAAARAPVLGVGELAARLDSALSALGSGPQDAPPRQRTLRATLDWSHRLLSPAEQLVLARLSVFASDCTIDAAETVADADLETLDGLVSSSLLRRRSSRSGQTRLGMLEVVRQYANERLRERDDASATCEAHCDYYIRLSERARGQLRGREQQRWFDLLDDEMPNLRGALRWALSDGRAESALRLASAIDLWWERSALVEGRAWLEHALEAGRDAPARVRAEGLLALGFLVASGGDTAGGFSHLEQARHLAREAADQRIEADCLMHRSFLETILDRPDCAIQTADEAWTIATNLQDRWLIAMSLYGRANAVTAADSVEAARPEAQQAVELLRDLGDLRHVASLQSDLAYAALLEHDVPAAGPLIDEVVEISRRTDDASMLAVALGNQGLVALEGEDDERAAAVLSEMLEHCSFHGIWAPVPEALTAAAAIAVRNGATETAARLVGAAAGSRVDAPSPVEEDLHHTVLDAARERVGAHRWDRCRAAGGRMSLDEAIRDAVTALATTNHKEQP